MSSTGARHGVVSGLRRLVAAAMARELTAFVLPGPEIARAHGLDLAEAGLRLAATPRHAGVLLVAGPLPVGLRDAATIAYAQMPRPRAILALGAGDLAPLPAADVTAALSPDGLCTGLDELRHVIAAGAFCEDIADFTAPALETRIEYTCPMHPEVVSDQPGNCPKCGMTLMPRETAAGAGHAGHTASTSEATVTEPKMPAKPHATHNDSQHASADAVQYTCPMHPEVVSDQPGCCPKCGMHLVPVEGKGGDAIHAGHGGHSGHIKHAGADAVQYTCPMHPEVVSDQPGSCPKCGMHLVPAEGKDSGEDHTGHGHGDHDQHAEAVQYTCPMHPEVVSDQPGSCPKCGMFLVPVEENDAGDHSGHGSHGSHGGHGGHGGHGSHGMPSGTAAIDGIEPQFMSMVDITKDLPRSSDGLQMDWIEVPFGPFFPGLPGGLGLRLTLDGDTVARTDASSLAGFDTPLVTAAVSPGDFVARIAAMMPLAPVSYGVLAARAIEAAAGKPVSGEIARGRVGALERERVASHLSWLSAFGAQAGLGWLASRAGALQLAVQDADAGQIAALAGPIRALLRRLKATPALRQRLGGIARLGEVSEVEGPVARALGRGGDARSGDADYTALGFTPAAQNGGDALARFTLRCDEIAESLRLIAAAGSIAGPAVADTGTASGEGQAVVETPRGAARLSLVLEAGEVISAELDAPSARHLALIGELTAQQELGDALVAVASLDISPWEIRA